MMVNRVILSSTLSINYLNVNCKYMYKVCVYLRKRFLIIENGSCLSVLLIYVK